MNPIQPPYTPISPARRKQLERLAQAHSELMAESHAKGITAATSNRRHRHERRKKTEVRIPAYEMRTGKDRRKPNGEHPRIEIDA